MALSIPSLNRSSDNCADQALAAASPKVLSADQVPIDEKPGHFFTAHMALTPGFSLFGDVGPGQTAGFAAVAPPWPVDFQMQPTTYMLFDPLYTAPMGLPMFGFQPYPQNS